MLWWEIAAYVLLIATAATMRVWDLGSRALHHDESLHAYFTWRLAELAGYRHDPMMHGPLQFEAGSVVFLFLGDTDFTARLLYAVAGTVLVALPFLLRGRLGRTGALLTAGMLAFSPSMLYFSRFARNDILMAVWTLGLVISMWRYLDEGKDRYLYSSAALLALAFATKETAYIVTVVLGAYLAFLLLRDGWRGNGPILDGERSPSPPEAMARLVVGAWHAVRSAIRRLNVSRPAAFLLLLVTLTMPQWSAAVSLFQGTPLLSWTGLVLAQSEGAHIGAPEGGGLIVAFLVVAVVLALSVYWGCRWRWPVWWRCAVIFYGIWALLYTTFFTNITGVGSGVWRSLGYWIVQQGEARGDQPWYYYFLLTPLYEFLPLLFSLLAGLYYWRRRDAFGRFLVYWSVAGFVLYTIASEKMPWLLVNITPADDRPHRQAAQRPGAQDRVEEANQGGRTGPGARSAAPAGAGLVAGPLRTGRGCHGGAHAGGDRPGSGRDSVDRRVHGPEAGVPQRVGVFRASSGGVADGPDRACRRDSCIPARRHSGRDAGVHADLAGRGAGQRADRASGKDRPGCGAHVDIG